MHLSFPQFFLYLNIKHIENEPLVTRLLCARTNEISFFCISPLLFFLIDIAL